MTKLAYSFTALVCATIVAPSASAESGRTLLIETFRGTGASHEAHADCIHTTISISVGNGERRQPPAPSSTVYLNSSLVFEISDSCEPGARKSFSGALNLATAPAIAASYDTVDVLFEADVPVWACAEQPDGLFECHDESVPVLLEAHWTGRGSITHSTNFARLPQGDGTTLVVTSRSTAREADESVSGTIGEHVIDYTSSDGYLHGYEMLQVQVPSK